MLVKSVANLLDFVHEKVSEFVDAGRGFSPLAPNMLFMSLYNILGLLPHSPTYIYFSQYWEPSIGGFGDTFAKCSLDDGLLFSVFDVIGEPWLLMTHGYGFFLKGAWSSRVLDKTLSNSVMISSRLSIVMILSRLMSSLNSSICIALICLVVIVLLILLTLV